MNFFETESRSTTHLLKQILTNLIIACIIKSYLPSGVKQRSSFTQVDYLRIIAL